MKCAHCTPSPANNETDGATKVAHADDLEAKDQQKHPKASGSPDKRRRMSPVIINDANDGSSTEENANSPILIASDAGGLFDMPNISGGTPKKSKITLSKKETPKICKLTRAIM